MPQIHRLKNQLTGITENKKTLTSGTELVSFIDPLRFSNKIIVYLLYNWVMKTIKLLFCFSLFIFSFSFTYGQSWLWGKEGYGQGEGYSIATNSKGESYLTGVFMDSINFGNVKLNNGIAEQLYIVKYDQSGNAKWAVASYPKYSSHYLSNDMAVSYSVARDKSDNAFIAGFFRDTIALGTFTLSCASTYNLLLSKIDSNGNVLWAKQSINNNTNGVVGFAVSADKDGNAYATGYFYDTAQFGANKLAEKSFLFGAFLVKYNSAGTVIWAKQGINSTHAESEGEGITTDRWGNIYCTGQFIDTVSFGSFKLSSASYSVFVVKYDSNGNVKWAVQANTHNPAATPQAYSVVTDNIGNPYITGCFQDTINFGSASLICTYQDIFLTKYDTSGNVIWAKEAEDSNQTWVGYSLTCDTLNHIYLSGGEDHAPMNVAGIKFGNIRLTLNNVIDPSVLLAFDTSGNAICGSLLPSGGDDNSGIGVSPLGNYVFLGADFESYTMIIGMDTLTPPPFSSEYPIITRWEPCGVLSDLNQPFSTTYLVNVHPNPSPGTFTLQTAGTQNFASATIEIYNVLGECVLKHILRSTQDDNRIELNQPNGIYLYRVLNEDGSLIGEGKVIISK